VYDSIPSKFDVIYSSTDLKKVKKAASILRDKIKMAWVCILTSDKTNYHLELTNEWGSKISEEVRTKAKKLIAKV
jgi:hypothetical protein